MQLYRTFKSFQPTSTLKVGMWQLALRVTSYSTTSHCNFPTMKVASAGQTKLNGQHGLSKTAGVLFSASWPAQCWDVVTVSRDTCSEDRSPVHQVSTSPFEHACVHEAAVLTNTSKVFLTVLIVYCNFHFIKDWWWPLFPETRRTEKVTTVIIQWSRCCHMLKVIKLCTSQTICKQQFCGEQWLKNLSF